MGMIDDHLGGGNLYGRYHRVGTWGAERLEDEVEHSLNKDIAALPKGSAAKTKASKYNSTKLAQSAEVVANCQGCGVPLAEKDVITSYYGSPHTVCKNCAE